MPGRGSVFMIDSRKDARAASAGSILVTRLMVRGVGGIVTDGGLRDAPEIADLAIPAYHNRPSATHAISPSPGDRHQRSDRLRRCTVFPGTIRGGVDSREGGRRYKSRAGIDDENRPTRHVAMTASRSFVTEHNTLRSFPRPGRSFLGLYFLATDPPGTKGGFFAAMAGRANGR